MHVQIRLYPLVPKVRLGFLLIFKCEVMTAGMEAPKMG